MAAPKTIVITLPKQLNGTPMVLPAPSATTTAIASKQLTDLLSGNFVQVIKEEIPDKMLDDTGKPPRKRQRLDHLTMEEKIMRRKLKNRVAAQTARDRKKMRMDQLEAQLSELSEHVTEVDKLNAILTEQNAELASKKEVLEMVLSKCICGLGSQMEEEEEEDDDCTSETQKPNVFEGVVIPVSTQIVGSAVSFPQQRAISVLAVIRIMVLSALCYQWVDATVMTLLKMAANNLAPNTQLPIQSQRSLKRHLDSNRWWGPHQQAWNPVGT